MIEDLVNTDDDTGYWITINLTNTQIYQAESLEESSEKRDDSFETSPSAPPYIPPSALLTTISSGLFTTAPS